MQFWKRKNWILMHWLAIPLILSMVVCGCANKGEGYEIERYADKSEYRTDGVWTEREKACLTFIREKMMKNGGIYTGYLESYGKGEAAKGHEVLAESEGLMLRYAVQKKDKALYQEIKGYITNILEQEMYLSYRADEKGTAMKVNACVDDLRIIRGLLEGGDYDLALRYARQLQKTNFKKGVLVDYYTASDKRSADTMTLCYGDLKAMDMVAEQIEAWKEIRANTEQVMLGGYLGDDFPFFQTRYQVHKKQYVSENIFMIEALLTAYHLSEVGKCPQRTVEWIEENLKNGKIFGTYTVKGEPIGDTESTAVYAICMLIGQQTGNQTIVQMAQECLEKFQVMEEKSEIFGAFGEANTLEVYSFDNLMALMALRTIADGDVMEEEKIEKADTLCIASEKKRNLLEPILKSIGKTVDFLEARAVTENIWESYRYVITTEDEILEQIPEDKKVFAVGTSELPKKQGNLAYAEKAYVTFQMNEFTEVAKMKEQFFYVKNSVDGQAYGELSFMQEKVPYSIVNEEYGYAAYVDCGELSSVALSSALRDFLEKPQKNGKFYVMIDKVYPFTNQKMLAKMGKDLYENGIPYLLQVMPVYDNLSYPAFDRWAEQIRKLQEQGAAPVLHAPVDTGGTDADEQELKSKLLVAQQALEYRGVNLYSMETMPLSISLDFLKNVTGKTRNFEQLPVDTVLVLPVYDTQEEWAKDIQFLSEKWIKAVDYRNSVEKEEIFYEKGKEKTYQYREKHEASMKDFFNRSNKVLLVIVGGAVFLFLFLLFSSYRVYQDKFRNHEK